MAWLKGWLNLTCIIIQWTSLFLYLRIWLNKLCSLTFLELCGSVWSSFLSISISINFHFHLFLCFFDFDFYFHFYLFLLQTLHFFIYGQSWQTGETIRMIYIHSNWKSKYINHIYQNIYICLKLNKYKCVFFQHEVITL